ncbi:MAG TPA: protein kinase [Gemmataceae bacterium]|nr:protein kinase [Gemmataceae bacterium]
MNDPLASAPDAHPAIDRGRRSSTSPHGETQVQSPEDYAAAPTLTWSGPATVEAPPVSVPGYEILDVLGRGGMGVVYKARQLGLNRVCALKMVLAGGHAGATELARFRTEAEAVARLQHPHIVAVYDVGMHEGKPFISLEYCPGGSLDRALSGTPMEPPAAAKLVRDLAGAMQAAHEARVVHRDLKPSNILLAADRTPKVSDFGLAKMDDAGHTRTGAVMGTPSYMAPEQAEGRKDVGPLVDVYSLGAILYDCLTGRPPFKAATGLDTLRQVIGQEPVPPTELNANVPRDLETIALKCLQKEPAKRYASARELADDLGRFLDGQPITARPVGATERFVRWCRRNPGVAGLAATVALLLVAVAAVTSVLSYRLSVKRNEAEENARQAQVEQRNAELARDDERKARKTATEQRELALDTIRGVLLRVDDLMKNDVRLAPLRVEIIRRMMTDLDKVRDHALKNPLHDRTEAMAFARIGEIYYRANRIEEAAESFGKAHKVLKAVVDDAPTDPAALRNLAAVTHQLADAEWRLGKGTRARALHADGLRLRQERVKLLAGSDDEMAKADAASDVAESYSHVGYADLRLGDPVRAVENYRLSDAGFAALPPPMPNFLKVKRTRAEIQVRLGDARSRLNETDAAERHYLDALDERQTLLRNTARPLPAVTLIKTDVGQSRMYLGDFLLMIRKDPTAASAVYGLCMRDFAEALESDPDSLDLRQRIAAAHYRLGLAAGERTGVALLAGPAAEIANRAHHYAECLRLREELAKIDTKDTQGQVELLLALARVGRTADAEKVAAALLAQADTDPQTLFQTACGLSILSAGTDDAAKGCRDQAFRVLDKLIDSGWKDRVGLETDPDFQSIRQDRRFGELITKLVTPPAHAD